MAFLPQSVPGGNRTQVWSSGEFTDVERSSAPRWVRLHARSQNWVSVPCRHELVLWVRRLRCALWDHLGHLDRGASRPACRSLWQTGSSSPPRSDERHRETLWAEQRKRRRVKTNTEQVQSDRNQTTRTSTYEAVQPTWVYPVAEDLLNGFRVVKNHEAEVWKLPSTVDPQLQNRSVLCRRKRSADL